jgi:hypothetical protein
MPDEVKALTVEEIEFRRRYSWPPDRPWLATLDARDAEIAALKRERDSAVHATARACAEEAGTGLVVDDSEEAPDA